MRQETVNDVVLARELWERLSVSERQVIIDRLIDPEGIRGTDAWTALPQWFRHMMAKKQSV